MSVFIYPCYDDLEPWIFNANGWGLIGKVHKASGTDLVLETLNGPELPLSMTDDDAKEMSRFLKSLKQERIIEVMHENNNLWGGTAEAFIKHINDWADFLADCGGYEAG